MWNRQAVVTGLALTLVFGAASATGWSADGAVADSNVQVVNGTVPTQFQAAPLFQAAPQLQHVRPRPARYSTHAEWYAARHAWHDAFIDNYPELRASRYNSRNPDSCVRKEILATKGWFAYIAGNGPAIWVRN